MKRTMKHHSLRTRLLLLLCSAVILTACIQAFIAYRTSLDEINEIFDYQMQQIARSLQPGFPVNGLSVNLNVNVNVNVNAHGAGDLPTAGPQFLIQVTTLDGQKIFQSSPAIALPLDAKPGISVYESGGTTYKVYSHLSGARRIQVAQDRESRRNMARTLALRTETPIVAMVPLLILLVWWVVSVSLTPLERVRKQLAERHADALSEVEEAALPSEVRPLVHEFNLLLGRVRNAYEGQKNFIADAAHELRSPLAALKLQIDGLRRATDASTRDLAINRLTSGIDRATRLVAQLLVLARQQASPVAIETQTQIVLSSTVRSIVGDLWETAQAHQLDFGMAMSDPGTITGYADALCILIRNLLDNAIKYTPPGGTINVSVVATPDTMQLSVEDSGPGLSPQDRHRVFDRFYRVTGSPGGGSGLGLAIVKSVADVHSAMISMGRAKTLGGLRVEVTFRRSDANQQALLAGDV